MKIRDDHRQAVVDRLAELGKTKYWLAQQLQGKITANMLYAYLRGKTTTSEKLEAICQVLGLKIAWDEKKVPPAARE